MSNWQFREKFQKCISSRIEARNSICRHSVAAVIVLGLGAFFLLFVLLFYRRVPSHSCEALRELLTDTKVWDVNENLPNNFGNARVDFSIPNHASSFETI